MRLSIQTVSQENRLHDIGLQCRSYSLSLSLTVAILTDDIKIIVV